MKRFVLFVSLFFACCVGMAQELLPTPLDSNIHDTRDTLTELGLLIESENDGSRYTEGVDYWYTVYGPCLGSRKLVFSVVQFDVDPSDTLFIYDGPDINSPLLVKGNNSYNNMSYQSFFVSSTNTTNCLTIRFKTNSDGQTAAGFQVKVDCTTPCENVVPHIDHTYYRTRNGIVYDTANMVSVPTYDSATGEMSGSYISVNLCLGDGLILTGGGNYSNYTGYYTPSDETSMFTWRVNTGYELVGLNLTTFEFSDFPEKSCYEISLTIMDQQGCGGEILDMIRVRLADNPITSISDDLAVFCNDTCILLTSSVSSDSIPSTLVIDPTPSEMVSKVNEARTFIPDGPNCSVRCYEATVEFREFPAGRTVNSGSDICSVCVNYEHTYMGDYDLSIKCPTGQKSVLKYHNLPTGYPSGAAGGGSMFTGYPYGGNDFLTYDGYNGASVCDSIGNMYGVGLDYCFSRNVNYTLVSGLPASTTTQAEHYLGNYNHTESVTYTFDPIPAPFSGAGSSAGTKTFTTKHPSNHEEQTDYYMPADDFSQLVGCPLNGIWSIEICDEYGRDNGWVFSWSMDICGLTRPDDCQYVVGIDSIRWAPDYTVGGIRAEIINDDSAYVSTPDTAGVFPVMAYVYDEFGCVWDTMTHIKTSWTPTPDLGPDTSLCDPDMITLNATDRHHDLGEFSYTWEPFGQTTPEITTTPYLNNDTNYIVKVVNSMYGLECTGYDTLNVHLFPMPIPGFSTNVIPAAGCSPFEIQFVDTSQFGYTYDWRFGDGYTSQERNPYHYYSAGRFDVTQIVTTDFGCVDSVVRPQYVWVFSTPDAQFTWEPEYPTFNNPRVQLINQTYPMVGENLYEWYVQSDASGANFYQSYELDPAYQWQSPLTAGGYHVRLVSHTDNYDQNGNLVVCRDSVETTIMLIQDFLQFPTVITANGDGVNDRFVIHGLVEGLAYPNNTLRIYNRWGMKVYSKDNVRLDEDCWDPAADRAPAGTYFYYFNASGFTGNLQRSGSVEVLYR